MPMRRTLPAVFALLVLAGALPGRAAAQSPAPAAAPGDTAYLRPGDAIRLAVWRQPDFSGDFPVGPEGTIQHPLLNDVVVVGAPRSVIRDRLRQALSRYERDPSFVFDFLYRVSVAGEVRQPNLYPLPPETTIGQAIAAAGGATEAGRLDHVVLTRDGREMVLNLQSADPAVAELRVHSGDQIRVPRRASILRDYIAPFAAIVGALAASISVFRR
jgi:polysaccharide export outer membrane protein